MIYIVCSECGSSLELKDSSIDSDHDITLTAAPCDSCLEDAKEEGWDFGNEDGYETGHKEGYAQAREDLGDG